MSTLFPNPTIRSNPQLCHKPRLSSATLTALTFAALTVFGSIQSSQAALLWSADFSSYSAGNSISTNATTTNNSFTSITLAQPASGTTTNTAQPGIASIGTDMAMFGQVNNTGVGQTFVSWMDYRLNSLPLFLFGSSTMVVSFDSVGTATNPLAWNIRAVTSSNGTGSGSIGVGGNETSLKRYTYVYNSSGSSITLPGTLSTLADNNSMLYFTTNGTTFSQVGSTTSVTASVNGFRLLPGNTPLVNTTWGVYFDNFGVWNSSSDTFGGISVLALSPNVVVPEPTTSALLVGGLTALILFRRRRIQQDLSRAVK